MSVLAISNAHSRNVAKHGPALKANALPQGSQHHVSHNPDDLEALFTDAAARELQHLIIEGGDGTVRTAMTALINTYPKDQALPAISILPSGTTNQIASNIGVKNKDDIRRVTHGDYIEITTPLVRIKRKKQRPIYGFLFSTGAVPHVSRFAQDKLNANGLGGGPAVIGAVLKAVSGNKDKLMPPSPHKMKAKGADGTVFKHKGVVLGTMMTTLPSLMLGMDPFWGEEDAPLRMTWAEGESEKLARTVAGLWMGRKQDRAAQGYHSHNIDRLTLRTDAPAVIDGDFLDVSGGKLKIRASRPVTFRRTP